MIHETILFQNIQLSLLITLKFLQPSDITRISIFPWQKRTRIIPSQVQGFDPLINSAAGVFGLLMEEVLTPSVSKIWNEFPVQMNSRQPFRDVRRSRGKFREDKEGKNR